MARNNNSSTSFKQPGKNSNALQKQGTGTHIYFDSPGTNDKCNEVTEETQSVTLGSKDSFSVQSEEDPRENNVNSSDQIPRPKQTRTWASLLIYQDVDEFKLDSLQSSGDCIKLNESEIFDIEKVYANSLLGCFAGRWPGLHNVNNLVRYWGKKCKIIPHINNCIIFQFENAEDMENVLRGGPFNCLGKHLILKRLSEGTTFTTDELSKVRSWVKFPYLPLQCWHKTAMSKICSKIGKPICCDKATYEKRINACARALIEIDITVKPVQSFCIELPCGKSFVQEFEFDHLPKFCLKCKSFGHYQGDCNGSYPSSHKDKARAYAPKNFNVPYTQRPQHPNPLSAETVAKLNNRQEEILANWAKQKADRGKGKDVAVESVSVSNPSVSHLPTVDVAPEDPVAHLPSVDVAPVVRESALHPPCGDEALEVPVARECIQEVLSSANFPPLVGNPSTSTNSQPCVEPDSRTHSVLPSIENSAPVGDLNSSSQVAENLNGTNSLNSKKQKKSVSSSSLSKEQHGKNANPRTNVKNRFKN